MKSHNTRQLRMAISEFSERSTHTGLSILLLEVVIYISAIAGVIFMENFFLRVVCGIVAGLKISTLFVIAHDAAHASFVRNRMLNKIIARLAFLPSYHNYSLWLVAHNKSHHQSTNTQGSNSWSPLSKEEYDYLPGWRKHVEQFYRSPFGISFYYLIERWWKDKFFPYQRLMSKNRASYWLDFLLVSTYMGTFLWILHQVGASSAHSSSMELIMLAFLIPLVVSNFMLGFTVYEHHTHETIPWFRTKAERDQAVDVEEITMHVKFPHWYNMFSHHIMEHTAHHVDSRIPLYNLAKAQKVLENILGDELVTVNFSIKDFLTTMQKCKLYDFENHQWLDFNGFPTSEICHYDVEPEIEYTKAA